MKLAITLTASKLMSFCILAGALTLDILNGGATAFMFAIPFISALVLGKQYFDKERGV
jgi:hypothetical protein